MALKLWSSRRASTKDKIRTGACNKKPPESGLDNVGPVGAAGRLNNKIFAFLFSRTVSDLPNLILRSQLVVIASCEKFVRFF